MGITIGLHVSDPNLTGLDVTPPSAVTDLAASSVTQTTAVLTFTGPPEGDWAGTNAYDSGDFLQTFKTTATTQTLTGLSPGTPYSVTVRPWDSQKPGNLAADSNVVTFTTSPPTDVTAPTAPTGLTPTSVTATTVSLDWGDSIDTESGLNDYLIYDGATLVATIPAPTTLATITGLTPATTHSYFVTCNDNATPPNESGPSNVVTVTTSPGGTAYADLGAAGSGAVSTSTTSFTLNYTRAVAAGNTVMVGFDCAGSVTTGLTLTDNKGNTGIVDVAVGNDTASGGKMVSALGRILITSAVTTSDQVTVTGSATAVGAVMEAFAGFLSSPLDKTASNGTGTTNVISSGASGTLAQSNEVAFGVVSLLSTNLFNPGTGWSLLGSAVSSGGTSQRYVALAKQVVSSTASVTLTGTQNLVSGGTLANNNYAAALATYKISGTTAAKPVNDTPPTISGSTVVGNTLTGNTGTWEGNPNFGYQWFSGGVTIPSPAGTASTYKSTTNDIGKKITFAVTATNTAGSTTVTSAATAAITAASGGNVSATLVPKSGAWLSIWTPAGIDSVESTVFGGSRKFDVGYTYGSLANPSLTFINQQIAAGRFPMVSIEGNTTGMTYANIGSGTYDNYFAQWGTLIGSVKGKVLVVLFHEGDHKLKQGIRPGVSGQTAANYKAAYKRGVDVMRANGASNAVFVLCFAGPTSNVAPNAGQYADGMYPGQGYVDWITCDPYKAFGAASSQTTLQSWQGTINFVQDPARPWHTHGVSYGITETGVNLESEATRLGYPGNGYSDAVCSAWFTNGPGWVAAAQSFNPPLKMITLFDESKDNGSSLDVACRVEGNSVVRAAYASMANNAFFNQPHA